MELSKNEFLLQLDNFSRQLFHAGADYQSVLIRGAFNELSVSNITPRLEDIKICSVKFNREWAEDNGFELIRVMLDANPDPTYTHIFDVAQDNPFASRKNYIDTYFSNLNSDFYVVRAKGAIVSYFKPLLRFDVFSSSYDLLLDEKRTWLRYLDGKAIYRSVTPDLTKVLIDFTGSRIVHIKDRCIFIGSHPNWGHWMIDCFTSMATFEKLPDKADLKLVFGRLNDNQKSCLALLGIHQDRIIELGLDSSPEEAVRYLFDDLICIPETPKPAALRYLRNRFATSDVVSTSAQPEFVYISRRSQTPRHRVHNIDQVEEFFVNKGFLIIDSLEKCATGDLVSLLRKTKVIVMAVGADCGTFAMCNENAVAIILVSDGWLASLSPELIPILEIGHMYGLGLPVVLVAGKSIIVDNTGKDFLSQIDGPATYRLHDLEMAVERAIELSSSDTVSDS